MPIEVHILYWRELGRSGPIIRWAEVRGGRTDVIGRARQVSRKALGREFLVSMQDGPAHGQVFTTARSIARWREASPLPEPVSGDWALQVEEGSARGRFIRSMEDLLADAEQDGVLDLAIAASAADAISLALHGVGPLIPRTLH